MKNILLLLLLFIGQYSYSQNLDSLNQEIIKMKENLNMASRYLIDSESYSSFALGAGLLTAGVGGLIYASGTFGEIETLSVIGIGAGATLMLHIGSKIKRRKAYQIIYTEF